MTRLGFAAAMLALLCVPVHAAAFDHAGWIADLAQLRAAMDRGDANLEWAVSGRGMDLKATYATAELGLHNAKSGTDARRVMEHFVSTFGDGHFEIKWPGETAQASGSPPPSLCDRLGFFDAGESGAIATHLAGYRPIANRAAPHFPAGIVEIGGRRVGVLRITIFEPQGYPDLCPAILRARHLKAGNACDGACSDAAELAGDQMLLDEVQSQLRGLAARKPDALLVDLAGNGGGDDIAIAIARMVTEKPLPTPRMAFMRTKAWADALAGDEAKVDEALRDPATPHDILQNVKSDLAAAAAAANNPCDRAPLWDDQPITCSQVVTMPLYAGGLFPYDLPPALRGHAWSNDLSATASFQYVPGLWQGPVLLLVDRNTASASELMAAMLQDHHAAYVIGAPTYGAGCGHALDNVPVVLEHSGASVSMPDCQRLRADGSNEVEGITPDMLIAFRAHDSTYQRVRRLTAALPAALAAAEATKP